MVTSSLGGNGGARLRLEQLGTLDRHERSLLRLGPEAQAGPAARQRVRQRAALAAALEHTDGTSRRVPLGRQRGPPSDQLSTSKGP